MSSTNSRVPCSSGQRQSSSEWMTSVGVVIRCAEAIGDWAATRSGSVPTYSSGKKNPMSEDPTKLTGSVNARSAIAAAKRVVRPISRVVR